ncbi:biotin synthase [Bdellovibrio bacteriovorus]|uniref:Biotin synthase n=1 Tax=Bdellovibrio bacteriovorus TaxID=959 RepID=A0A162GQQ5_BDEBC|nr:putative DNA modification/repair radical SAM protein [Bdellovibrio bacteriovorus]KYG68721.1 biotin synthase [Bdellovibrio bacteriovorus]
MALPDWNLLKSKLSVLADAAKYDASCSSSGSQRKRDPKGMGNVEGMGICHSYAPDGRCISLLKILMTNFCIFDCKYCVNRVSSDVKRAKFSPEEIVTLTLEFYRRNYIEGLFLSSGIVESSDSTMEKLILVAKTLRQVHRFQGYIHLKVVAGASQELIEEAGLWADRVSANIEMPAQPDLDLLAPAKTIESATTSMDQIAEKVKETKEEQKKTFRAPRFAPAGQTTQMIVGATPSSDSLILQSSQNLYKKYSLRRVYYSAYSPIPHADVLLPTEQPPLIRENRLYQADWLLRFYKFDASELTSAEDPNLALDMDPKTAWALKHREYFPVNVNTASREQLLRVPGFGVRNVERILQMRPFRKITLMDLAKLRVPLKRARYFVITSDHNPDVMLLDSQHLKESVAPSSNQLSLFDLAVTAKTGEL